MTETIRIRMAGYGPATTGFSKSLNFFVGKSLNGRNRNRITGVNSHRI